jgi:hypothetical protein
MENGKQQHFFHPPFSIYHQAAPFQRPVSPARAALKGCATSETALEKDPE